MPSPDKLFLLGLPGSGKTSLGKQLAVALKLAFVDLDSEIERQAGKRIKTIFLEKGEAQFREIESSELRKWCQSASGFVMATGGGTPCFHNNMDLINEAGVSVFLDVPVSEIVKRMEKTTLDERPLLQARSGLLQKIERMHEERIRFYKQATVTVSGDRLTVNTIIQVVRL